MGAIDTDGALLGRRVGTAQEPTRDPNAVLRWLAEITERRDLGLPLPPDPQAAALAPLLDVLSREFADYRDVVATARDAARANADQLRAVVRSTADQGTMIRATADAADEARTGAQIMNDAAAALNDLAQTAAVSSAQAGEHLTAIDAALRSLGENLSRADRPLTDMRGSTGGVSNFLVTLGRLSRHAQLLSVNASIEAAHLDETGDRFAIVAQEVRKLSISTRESKTDVAHIVGELREATKQIAGAIQGSQAATAAAGGEIGDARRVVSRTGEGIGEFAGMVTTIASATAAQTNALVSIATSLDEIARHAEEAANASHRAARLELDALVERTGVRAERWQLRPKSPAGDGADSALHQWITGICEGADPHAPHTVDSDDGRRSLVAAVRTFIDRVNGEQRAVLADIISVAVAVSQNGYAWRSIYEALGSIKREIGVVRGMVAESAAGARTSAELAGSMQRLVGDIRREYDAALTLLEGTLARIGAISAGVGEIDGLVTTMSDAASRADGIMTLIEALSSETDLLSLNAAIEAAHAGDLGLGFSVIAEEIRALARATNDSTASVSQVVANIAAVNGELQGSIRTTAGAMDEVLARADTARGAIGALRRSFESAIEHSKEVSDTTAGQLRALERVLDDANRSDAAVDANSSTTTERSRLELALLGSRGHGIAARRPIGTVVAGVRAFTERVCERLEAVLDAALESRRVTRDRLFTLSYREITGSDCAPLRRLFDVSKVPAHGFTPKKYATPWDAAVDEALIAVLTPAWEEAVAAGFAPVTIFVSDLNGLFYAYPQQKIAAWTNDFATDNGGNRIKRMFEDEYALRIARIGLGEAAADLGPRCTYDAFRIAGCTLERVASRPWGAYVYARDTSLVCNEVVMAVYAGGLRHSTLRVCYDPALI